jgi:DNA topoisomerase VI subunit A
VQRGHHGRRYADLVQHLVGTSRVLTRIPAAASLLGLERHQLNVEASGKGLVAGPLRFRTEDSDAWVDVDPSTAGAACGSGGVTISSAWIHSTMSIESAARMILVVEKECVFRR